MQKFLILYSLLFITTCSQSESLYRCLKPTRRTQVTSLEAQKPLPATSDLTTFIIVNRKIAPVERSSPLARQNSNENFIKQLINNNKDYMRTWHPKINYNSFAFFFAQ